MAEEIDWCARAAKLRDVEMAMLSGEMVTEARFGTDGVKYATATLQEVKRDLDIALRNCAVARGEAPARTRYALRPVARPY
ncbi:hypothetical protein NPA31_007215 [Aurantimonas sp. MSK8Z-1]|uniref:hypothetical protein n=1 Tax=Mangrovibrevibacter kandeliae TaxID=2968473 RepID=UPI00211940C3|nr:hypothetical protein [Aurantimonas sp. MSK8Z-1]MCW4114751.1 hypothetical protein [Aurantimonas sp. MSK8Z-1]